MMDSSSQDEARYWGVLNRFRDFTRERPEYAGRSDGATCVIVLLVGVFGLTVSVLFLFLDATDVWPVAAALGGLVAISTAFAFVAGTSRSRVIAGYNKRAKEHAGWEAALVTFARAQPWLHWASPYRNQQPTEAEQSSESQAQLTRSSDSKPTDPKHQGLLPVHQFLVEHWPDRAPRHLLGRVADLVPPWRVTLRAKVGGFASLIHVVDGDAVPSALLLVLVATPLNPRAASTLPTETTPGRQLSEDGFHVGWTRAGPYAVRALKPTSKGTASLERLTADLERALHRTVQLARIGPKGARVRRAVAPDVLRGRAIRHDDGIPISEAILKMLRDQDHLGVLAHAYPPAFKSLMEPRVEDLGPIVEEAFRPTQWELVERTGSIPCIAVGTYLATVPNGARYRYVVEVFNPNNAWYMSHFCIYEKSRQLYEFGESLDDASVS